MVAMIILGLWLFPQTVVAWASQMLAVSSVNGGIPFNGQVSTEDAINIAQSDRAVLLSARRQQRQRGNSDVGVAPRKQQCGSSALTVSAPELCLRPRVEYPSKKE